MYNKGVVKYSRKTSAIAAVNAVSFLRIVLGGVIVWLTITDRWLLVFWCAIVAFVSDWVDGVLARRWAAVSQFGKFIDPFADKVVCLGMLWPLAAHYNRWWYWVAAVLLTLYDLSTITMRLRQASAHLPMIGASRAAKVKTAFLMLGLLLLTAALTSPVAHWSEWYELVGALVLLVSTVLAARSLLQYRYGAPATGMDNANRVR